MPDCLTRPTRLLSASTCAEPSFKEVARLDEPSPHEHSRFDSRTDEVAATQSVGYSEIFADLERRVLGGVPVNPQQCADRGALAPGRRARDQRRVDGVELDRVRGGIPR